MVAGPDKFDNFSNDGEKPWFTEPSIASNAGLVAALVALHDYLVDTAGFNGKSLGIDQISIFDRIPYGFYSSLIVLRYILNFPRYLECDIRNLYSVISHNLSCNNLQTFFLSNLHNFGE